MSRLKFPIVFGLLTLALVATPMFAQSTSTTPSSSSSSASGQSGQQPDASTQSNPSSSSSSMSSSSSSMAGDAQTFTGRVAKSGGKYILKDTATSTSYTLDDQDRAKQFEGKTVKVTGKLDASSNTIRVASIEPGS